MFQQVATIRLAQSVFLSFNQIFYPLLTMKLDILIEYSNKWLICQVNSELMLFCNFSKIDGRKSLKLKNSIPFSPIGRNIEPKYKKWKIVASLIVI